MQTISDSDWNFPTDGIWRVRVGGDRPPVPLPHTPPTHPIPLATPLPLAQFRTRKNQAYAPVYVRLGY